MAVLTPDYRKPEEQRTPRTKRMKPSLKTKQKPPSSWEQIKNLVSCKQADFVHNPNNGSCKRVSSCSSICSFKDVVNGNTRVVHRGDNSPESSSLRRETKLVPRKSGHVSSFTRSEGMKSNGGTCTSYSKGMQFTKFAGCYECRMIVDPSRYPMPRAPFCSCPQCGEVFPKAENLELHQRIRHAVSELAPDDSSRNVVEIIFKSSWLKKDSPLFAIERVLKVHNTQRTIQRFEDCRDAVKARAIQATKKNPRCAADGNELLRFHCTTLECCLGSGGSSTLCGSLPACGVCTAIRHGFQTFKEPGKGVRTTASSGMAHDSLTGSNNGRTQAMLVCRVIAGRVSRLDDEVENSSIAGACDSMAGQASIYSNPEELFVLNPKAILPCFVVIYKVIDSS